MPETPPLVVKGEREEKRGINHCFYCQEAVGTPHKDDCVMWTKKVKVRATIEYEIEMPHSFDKAMIEFSRNEGTWCASNMIGELERLTEDYTDEYGDTYSPACLCYNTHFEVIE